MESSVGNFYFQIKHSSFDAYAFITDTNVWRMLLCQPDSAWPQQPTWRRGTWQMRGNVAHCFSLGSAADAPSSNNQTMVEVFRLTDLEFPPDLSSSHGFWIKQFFLSDGFADREHVQKGIVKTAPHKLSMPTHGSWTPFITGPLVNATEQKLRAFQEELKRLAIQVGLDIASLVDPTGAMSIPAAGYAMSRGDYLGCCINLLGVIPLFGKAAPAAKLALINTRLAFLTKEITFLQKWLEISIDATRRVRQVDPIAGSLKVEIQGTTKAAAVSKAVTKTAEAAEELKNLGWIHKIFNADKLGLLPEELRVLRGLAKEGYYFVIRSCNPTRAEWLRLGTQHGWGMIGKPVWLKIKSLKDVKFAGLVGMSKRDSEYVGVFQKLELVKDLPPSVKLPWLAAKGISLDTVKVYRLRKGFDRVPHVEDAEMMLSHYFVDTGDAFVIVDRAGRPYVPDLDIVSIQRTVGHNRFGPAGYNVGPAAPLTKFRGADNAEMSAFWNRRFGSGVRYPPGYEPFGWHGGWGGSAAFIKKVPKNFLPGMDVRKLGWNPEKPTEDLIVAVKGIEKLGDDVGYVTGWDKLGEFQRANSGMGEFRFEINQ